MSKVKSKVTGKLAATKTVKMTKYPSSKFLSSGKPLIHVTQGKFDISSDKTASYVVQETPGLAVEHEHEIGGPPSKAIERRESVLAKKLVTEIERHGSDVTTLCDTYQLRREELGRLTGFSLRALAEWASGKLPSQPAQRRLREVRRLLDALAEIVKSESIPAWLHRPNSAFDKMTPLQVIEVGEIDRLWEMVHDLASGQPD